jgi:hypothetical protein
VAWRGSQTGKAGKPTIVLEAFDDHNLWFWHHSFGGQDCCITSTPGMKVVCSKPSLTVPLHKTLILRSPLATKYSKACGWQLMGFIAS